MAVEKKYMSVRLISSPLDRWPVNLEHPQRGVGKKSSSKSVKMIIQESLKCRVTFATMTSGCCLLTWKRCKVERQRAPLLIWGQSRQSKNIYLQKMAQNTPGGFWRDYAFWRKMDFPVTDLNGTSIQRPLVKVYLYFAWREYQNE